MAERLGTALSHSPLYQKPEIHPRIRPQRTEAGIVKVSELPLNTAVTLVRMIEQRDKIVT